MSTEQTEESKKETLHKHCGDCFRMNCVEKPDNIQCCDLTYCKAGCGARFHSCKSADHQIVCRREKVPCINKVNGCPLEVIREKMSAHLPICPASVILCSREWNRWPMHSQEACWKAPMPFKNPHVKCGQYDVAFALRDQRMLMDSFKTPLKTRRILRNPLTQHYPAVPIQSHSSAIDSPTSDTSLLSDDDSGTPWDINQSPPGLQRTISNQLSAGNSLYTASREATESLTLALDYVTGKQGLKRLSEIARKKEEILKQEQDKIDAERMIQTFQSSSLQNDTSLPNGGVSSELSDTYNEEDEFAIYYNEKKLFEILGLDLTIHRISSYQHKPAKMFTFLCGQEFRRDEYPWHIQNFHSEMQCNLNNWFEQRCPLSYAGCTFAFQRFQPKKPSGTIVHSQILQTFGHSAEVEFEADKDHVNTQLTEDEDVRTTVGKQRLREATPEIHTSYKCDSTVRVIPRYKSASREVSPVKYNDMDQNHTLTDLPFEVLQNIIGHLDSYSLQHVSMSCKLLQSVCCSVLDKRGVVSLVWEKVDSLSPGPKWQVAYKKWHFTNGFTPIESWKFTDNSCGVIHEHLKVCPYNQDQHKNIKTDSYKLMIQDYVKCE